MSQDCPSIQDSLEAASSLMQINSIYEFTLYMCTHVYMCIHCLPLSSPTDFSHKIGPSVWIDMHWRCKYYSNYFSWKFGRAWTGQGSSAINDAMALESLES